MKALLAIVLALLPGIVCAVGLPFAGEGLPLTTGPEAVSVPDPARLQANWWDYLAVEGETLDGRIAETKQRLQAVLAGLEEPDAAVQGLVEQISANLDALARVRQRASPEPPPPRPDAERYTVSRLLDIARERGIEQLRLDAERIDTAALEKTIRFAQRRLDTLLAAYLGLDEDDPDRVPRGLEIMAERLAVALAEERLRLARATVAATDVRVQQLVREQAVAAERLAAESADVGRLAGAVEEALAALEQAQENSARERSRALSELGDDAQAKIQTLYRQQRVVHAAVLEAIAGIRLTRVQAERELVRLLLDGADVQSRELRTRVAGWRDQVAEVRREAATLTRDSERERGRASEALAGGAREGGAGATPFDVGQLLHQDRLDLAQKTLVSLQSLRTELAQSELLIALLGQQIAAREGTLRDWWNQAELALVYLGEAATGWLNQSLFKLGDTPVTSLGLLRVMLILVIAWSVSHWWRRALERIAAQREGINRAAIYTVGRLSHYVIITLGLMAGLASIGLDFSNFALLASAMAIGMGFGLQSIVSNFVSGLILLFERSLKVGDFVELASGIEGEVREISVRSTRINTNDNVDVVVPNSEFINQNVINWTLQEDFRRIHIPFRVAYGTDIERVTRAALEAAERVPFTLKRRNPGVWVVDFGESSLDFELVVWVTPEGVKRPGAVKAAYKKELVLSLYQYDIEVPVPQRDLRLRSGFEEGRQGGPGVDRRRGGPVEPTRFPPTGKGGR